MIGAIVLAAGVSRRYGARSKLLAPLAGRPLVAHSVDWLRQCPVRPVVVVTGRQRMRVRRALARCLQHQRADVRFVHNPAFRHGMASSLRRGLEALPQHCHAALICLGDMPSVDVRTIKRLCAVWRPGLDYVRPVHAGLPGHPVIVSRSLFSQLAALQGDRGAKAVLAKVSPERRRLIEAGPNCLNDIDTPTALRRVARGLRLRRGAGLAINRGDSQNQSEGVPGSFMV